MDYFVGLRLDMHPINPVREISAVDLKSDSVHAIQN
jgi:hypothetical protein